MDIAVPANLRCGRPEGAAPSPAEPSWAPLTYTFAGIFEIQPQALEECAASIQIVDVRERNEFDGPLGRIRDARWIPLEDLPARNAELARDRPVVAVCRSGARSAQASVLLSKAGFPYVANLAGGMLRWRAERTPGRGCTGLRSASRSTTAENSTASRHFDALHLPAGPCGRPDECLAVARGLLELAGDAAAYQIAERIDLVVGDAVVDARAAAFARDHAVLGQHGQVPRNVRRRVAAELRQLPDVALAFTQVVEDLQARRFGQRLEIRRHLLQRLGGKILHAGTNRLLADRS